MAIDQELREHAEGLYMYDGLTLEQVSKETGISEATVMRWSAEDGWPDRKRERLERKRKLKESLEDLAETMVNQAISTKHAQDVHAAIGLTKLSLLREKKTEGAVPDIDRPRVFLEDLEFVAEVLREIDPEGLKIFARSFEEIVKRFKESLAADTR